MAKRPSRKPPAPRSEKSDTGILGLPAELRPIRSVEKNTWNANRMSAHKRASLKHGLKTDGWLTSQALTVWGHDDKGRPRNVIIDGEHRWEVALELGTFDLVPMVVLDGLTEAQAKAWTLKLGRHGDPQEDLLSQLVRDLDANLGAPDLALEVGIEEDHLAALLADPAEPSTPVQRPTQSVIQYNIIFSSEAQQQAWYRFLHYLKKRGGGETHADRIVAFVSEHMPSPSESPRAEA